MGRSKHCTPEKREIIVKLKGQKKSNSEIASTLGCSRKMVVNAINLVKKQGTLDNKLRKKRQKKTTPSEDRKIHRMSTADPFATSSEISTEFNSSCDANISARTVRRRLNEFGLRGCIAQRKPLITKRNQVRRLDFAKKYKDSTINFWKNILWSDESKFNRLGSDGKSYVRRPVNAAFNPRYTLKTVKHGGGSVMVWAAMSWYGVGPIVRIDTKMDQHVYKKILIDHMEPYFDDNMPLSSIFMHDNDPKHTSKLVKNWFVGQKIRLLDWPAQSPDLNPIEHLWNDVDQVIRQRRPTNLSILWETIVEAWSAIPPERCRNLVESMPRRLAAVIENKGFSTKY